ncbi:MAG: lytic transglycosylase domain-containing protein [Treponema sp.]|nr:lytic transglycosylase domain-containing protein [Treponema sp.]
MHSLKHTFPLFLLFTLLSFISCSASKTEQKAYGSDTDYFIGLTYLEEGRIEEAARKFETCSKKGTYYCARKSAEELCKIGDLQQKNKTVLNLIENYKDSQTLLIAARQLWNSREINKLIEISENLDFSKEKDETIRLRLLAMQARCDSRLKDEVYTWFTACPLSEQHFTFYRDNWPHPDFSDEEAVFTPQEFAINYRIELYRRNYTWTFNNCPIILEYFENKELPLSEQLASDIGKSYLYGSPQFLKNAQYFKAFANSYKGTKLEYYFWFYAGRFYDKAGNYYSSAKNCFAQAMNCANTESQKDDAIWYLLEISRNYNIESLISSIQEYSRLWNKASNFDSFFERLITPLLLSGKRESFYELYSKLDGYASDEVIGQYAYIYGRLCQEGYAQGDDAAVKAAFNRALKSGSNIYYKLLAAYELKLSPEEISSLIASFGIYQAKEINPAAEILLRGYADFGFPQYIYENYNILSREGISSKTAFYLAEFLQKCAISNIAYYPQSLRIASRAGFNSQEKLTKEELMLIYPKDYSDLIEAECSKYNMKDSLMYALVRSESFFDAEIVSSAGATGLTQLMQLTAQDIAKRLKITDYSLTDPAINLEFGTWYLNNLYERLDNSYLHAFYSYNAGINSLRKWLKGSIIDFGAKQKMPNDIFLETIPYAETREYGRKLVSATVMYEYLYNDNFAEILQQIIK